MTATSQQIEQLRRMVAESTTTTYDDDALRGYIECYPVLDQGGNVPLLDDGTINDDWTPTYDLSAAAADIWVEKAATLASEFDFSAEGQSFNRSQQHAMAMQSARYYRSRRAVSTIRLQTVPKPTDELPDAD